MGLLVKLLLSAVAVIIGAYLIPGVHVNSLLDAVLVAIVLGLLNAFVKPILTILTIPITILTLGLFLLVLNVLMIYLTDYFLGGFSVDGFIPALLFSLALAVIGWILDAIF